MLTESEYMFFFLAEEIYSCCTKIHVCGRQVSILKTHIHNERVCGTETISSMLIPPIPSHAPLCRMRIWWVKWASKQGLGSTATVHNFKLCACLLDSLCPHSVIQRIDIVLGFSVELLVSVPQTHHERKTVMTHPTSQFSLWFFPTSMV